MSTLPDALPSSPSSAAMSEADAGGGTVIESAGDSTPSGIVTTDVHQEEQQQQENESDNANGSDNGSDEIQPITIVGGGIAGLVLALCLHTRMQEASNAKEGGQGECECEGEDKDKDKDKDEGGEKTTAAATAAAATTATTGGKALLDLMNPPPGTKDKAKNADASSASMPPIVVYEQAPSFADGVGGAIGMYANGLRVIRDIDRRLLLNIRNAGYEYIYRRWYRHDGTELCVAEERHLVGEGRSGRRRRMRDERKKKSMADARGEVLNDDNNDDDNDDDDDDDEDSEARKKDEQEEEKELTPIGIRRWKLQRLLLDACIERGIKIVFGKRVESVMEEVDDEGPAGGDDGNNIGNVERKTLVVTFAPSSSVQQREEAEKQNKDVKPLRVRTRLLFGCDGVNSNVRNYVLGTDDDSKIERPVYTGVTCLMGASNIPAPIRGICFPSSSTTQCHMCTYPTGPNETIYQIYFPTPVENPESWGPLGPDKGAKERTDLANRMTKDGWCDRFVRTVSVSDPCSIVRVGLRAREPLSLWVRHVDNDNSVEGIHSGGHVALLGDAAHPPVPYIGQGAMMAVEDAGTISLLLSKMDTVREALNAYQEMRIPRTKSILGKSVILGKAQQDRADGGNKNDDDTASSSSSSSSSWSFSSLLWPFSRSMIRALWTEWSMRVQVWWYGTLPIMLPGPTYDYAVAVEEELLSRRLLGFGNNDGERR